MAVWRIVIPDYRPPTVNQFYGRHWRIRHRLGKEAKQVVAHYARLAGVPPATGRRRVALEVTLAGRQRESDPDSYQKLLLDALVACGALVDDSAAWVEWGGVAHSRGGRRSTTVVLEDLEGA